MFHFFRLSLDFCVSYVTWMANNDDKYSNRFWQSILKAYLRGVWDSLNGVWLIVIVIRDTYSSTALQNDKQDSELEESSSGSSNTHTSKRSTRRTQANKRELNKLKEYDSRLICSVIRHNWCSTIFFFCFFYRFLQGIQFIEACVSVLSVEWWFLWP